MKHTKKTISGLVALSVLSISSIALAESSNTSSSDSTMSQGDYWAERKIEEQRKSTEMRKTKYAEMKAKGYDMSSVSSDVLDASKTDESAFWNAMKVAMAAKDASNRKNTAYELKKNGFDTSSLTDDVLNPKITDEGAFWKIVKGIKEAREIEFKNSKPVHTEYSDSKKHTDAKMVNEEKKQVQVPNVRKDKPALTEKMRANLVKRFNAVPESRKEAYYTTAKANLEAQLNKANMSKNTRLAKKLMETLEILEYILGSNESEDE